MRVVFGRWLPSVNIDLWSKSETGHPIWLVFLFINAERRFHIKASSFANSYQIIKSKEVQ
jgi:hypothetical protein